MGTQNAKPFGRWCPIARVENGHKVKRHGSTDSASTGLKWIKKPTRNEEDGRRYQVMSSNKKDTIT